jgi:hypothetical protein
MPDGNAAAISQGRVSIGHDAASDAAPRPRFGPRMATERELRFRMPGAIRRASRLMKEQPVEIDLAPRQEAAFTRAMSVLNKAGVPYLVSGALAFYCYTDIWRNTKDLDLFLKPEDRDRALLALANAEYRVEVTVQIWLAKAFAGDSMVDLITGSGNVLIPIDDSWFANAVPANVLGIRTLLVSVTDLIWIKAYVAGRERFDGADIAHMIRRASDSIDWQKLLDRYGAHWELLLMYLIYYRFVYPEARQNVPAWVMENLTKRLLADLREPEQPAEPFRGTLLDRFSYLIDIMRWGEPDVREWLARQRHLPVEEVIDERAADIERVRSGQVGGSAG